MKIALLAVAVSTSLLTVGCAHGPSVERYAELLHECRKVNREHLRMLKEYEKVSCVSQHPSQSMDGAEMNLGGF